MSALRQKSQRADTTTALRAEHSTFVVEQLSERRVGEQMQARKRWQDRTATEPSRSHATFCM